MELQMPLPVSLSMTEHNVEHVTDKATELLALYKEVLEQFEGGGLNVPGDVTLLFTDDNHGTIRRLPTTAEAQRIGGAGVSASFLHIINKVSLLYLDRLY